MVPQRSWRKHLPLSLGANTEFPTFVPDVAGTYVAQLIVKDQFASSIPATVSISAGMMTISLTPSPLNLPNTPEPLTITLSPGAGRQPCRRHPERLRP